MQLVSGLIGGIIGALLTWSLQQVTWKRQDARDCRLLALDVRDLVWTPHPLSDVQNHVAKLGIRVHTLGLDRSVVDPVLDAAEKCIYKRSTDHVQVAPDVWEDIEGSSSEAINQLDRELEYLDLRLSQVGRVHMPRQRRSISPAKPG
jgi:hypothetical protein